MEQLLSYSTFINESNKPCVSFDFDGVLHKSVIGIHPTDMFHPETCTPSLNMFKQVKLESQNNDLVIVTARDNWNRPELETFVKMYNLPFTKIYFNLSTKVFELIFDINLSQKGNLVTTFCNYILFQIRVKYCNRPPPSIC